MRPPLCIGYDAVHVDEVLRDQWAAQLRQRRLAFAFNSPFAGSLVPTRFYQCDRRVRSLMIELRRDLYLDEARGGKTLGFQKAKELFATLLETAAARVRALRETTQAPR